MVSIVSIRLKTLLKGIFLFLIYFNDMPMAVKCNRLLYADDIRRKG